MKLDFENATEISAEVVESAPRINMSRRGIIKGLAAGTVVPIVAGCATDAFGNSIFVVPGFDNASLAQMSQAAWSDMKKQVPQTSDSRLRRRVLEIWDRTARGRSQAFQSVYGQSVAYNPQEWEVAVFDTQDVNAFVMPGQQVGVFRGLVDITENDDQISSVLGHEAGHVDRQHAAQRASQQVATQLAVAGASIAIAQSEELSRYGNEIIALGGAAIQFGVLLPYSRKHELEADKLGVDYMHAAGYDVKESVRLWQVMGAQGGQRPPEWMSTHPSPERRQQELVNYINARGYAFM